MLVRRVGVYNERWVWVLTGGRGRVWLRKGVVVKRVQEGTEKRRRGAPGAIKYLGTGACWYAGGGCIMSGGSWSVVGVGVGFGFLRRLCRRERNLARDEGGIGIEVW